MSDVHGAIWWSELMTRDVESARSYYSRVCGWVFETMPNVDGGDYHMARQGERPVAGLMDMSGIPGLSDLPAHWFTYIAVDDVDAAAAQTTAAGGSIERAPFDIAGVGRIAVVKDPGGAAVGLMTPAPVG